VVSYLFAVAKSSGARPAEHPHLPTASRRAAFSPASAGEKILLRYVYEQKFFGSFFQKRTASFF
jgi:hypothetical protein